MTSLGNFSHPTAYFRLLIPAIPLQTCDIGKHCTVGIRLRKQEPLAESRLALLLGVVLVAMALASLAGCGFTGSANAAQAPVALRGTVHGAQQPVSGSSVQLYATGISGVGSTAQPLLGNPVRSDSNGSFSIPASYPCPSASSQLYVVARGGSPGLPSGADNPALVLTALLGSCDSLSSSAPIYVNEVTTIGSVWPVAAYMKSPSEIGSAPNDSDFLAAVSSVNQFIDPANGSSPGTATATSYFNQSSKLYSLADVLARCVDSPGGSAGDGSPCGMLFSLATPSGASSPTDTMTAAMRIAQNPDENVTGIYDQVVAPGFFQPVLTAAPPDWTLQLSHPVAAPSISLGTGTYYGSQQVTISDSTTGSTIYYTTDGTVPTTASPAYSEALSIAVSSTIEAIAVMGASQSSVSSSTLTITTTHPPMQLAFRQQPTNVLTQAAISPAVTVAVEDANGNVVSSATNPVKLSLSGSATGLGGTLSVTPRNGIASFSSLTVGTAGNYTLSATSPGLTSATSARFTISQTSTVSTTISVALAPGSVTLTPSQTQTFTAAVAGTSNTAVTWSLSPSVGSISAAGLYTAPATVPYPNTVTITATSAANPTNSASGVVTIVPPAGTTYYLAPATVGGNDSNNGLSPGAPWLTPNHSVSCGDVIIAAAGSYSPLHPFGVVTCAAGNNVARLTCATFDGCKINVTASNAAGVVINQSYWQVDGWEVDGTTSTAQCFVVVPTNGANIHHIIIANDIANGCGEGGISLEANGSYSTDYFVVLGSIAYNTVGGSVNCNSGIDIWEPIATDSLPGTHIYIAGNFSISNIDGNPCAGGYPTDGEGIALDTLDALSYTGQVVADNNMLLANGGRGVSVGGNAPSSVYFRQNTVWGNDQSVGAYCGEIMLTAATSTQAFDNLAVTNKAKCGTYTDWAFLVQGTTTGDVVYQNWGYSASGNNDGTSGTSGFSYAPNNTFATNPNLANPVAPGAPSCGGFANVPACMAQVIANFKPTAAGAPVYGYQIPSSTSMYDPLFPQWLCNVNLPAGLVTMGCQTGP